MPAVMKAMRVPSLEHALDVVDALLGSSLSLGRTVAGTKSLMTQLQFDRHRRVVECLVIGVTNDEGHIVNAFAIHVVHCIAATAAHADDLDDAVLLLGNPEIENIIVELLSAIVGDFFVLKLFLGIKG